MAKDREDYIGDGVYVEYDGTGIMLKANCNSDPTDKVYLEAEVFDKLILFAKRMGMIK